MLNHVSSAALVIVGVIHILPLAGVIGSSRLAQLYGLNFDEPNLALLMRHRAVLFGLLGGFCIAAAFRKEWQGLAYGAGFTSVIAFLLLAELTGGYNDRVARIVFIDWIALAALLLGAWQRWQTR